MKAVRIPSGSIIFNISDANKLYQRFFGKPLGLVKRPRKKRFKVPLILDKYETVYLAEIGTIEVYKGGKPLEPHELIESYHKFNIRTYKIYKRLRDLGYVVRPGAKYGALFMVYEKGPGEEHAPYIVLYLDRPKGRDLVRVARLSHSVRKYALIAKVDDDVKFYVVKRLFSRVIYRFMEENAC